MIAVVVARAEEPYAQRLVDEKETAEVDGDRLDADANAVKIVAGRCDVIFVIDEQLLHGELVVVARRALARVDVDAADFTDVRAVEVDHRDEAQLDIGRLERRVAFDQRHPEDQIFDELRLPVAAELVVRLRAIRRLRADRGRHLPPFEQRVGSRG